MKKIVAIVALIAGFSVGCRAHQLVHKSVSIDVDNRSGERVTVTGQHGGSITLDDGEGGECTFELHQPSREHSFLGVRAFGQFETRLTARGEGRGEETIEVREDDRTLTIEPDLKLSRSGGGEGRGERRHRDRDRDRDEDEDRD